MVILLEAEKIEELVHMDKQNHTLGSMIRFWGYPLIIYSEIPPSSARDYVDQVDRKGIIGIEQYKPGTGRREQGVSEMGRRAFVDPLIGNGKLRFFCGRQTLHLPHKVNGVSSKGYNLDKQTDIRR